MAPSPKFPAITQKMTTHLDRRKSLSSHRSLTTFPTSSIDLSSNDFLSLSNSSLFRSAYLSELTSIPSNEWRIGSRGSRLLDGNSVYAEDLEREIAEFHGAEASLLFGSGYDGNMGFWGCVAGEGDIVIFDELVHASTREGIKLSRASKLIPFRHNNTSHLKSILSTLVNSSPSIRSGKQSVFIAVESLYSMDGDLSPLSELCDLVDNVLGRGNGLVVVDEAHSTGIYGQNGRGLVCELGLESRVFARLHTFGKALGCNGGKSPSSTSTTSITTNLKLENGERLGTDEILAAILCSKLTREYLINYAKPLIYTTAMGFPLLAAIKVVYSLMKSGQTDPLRNHLTRLISHTHAQLQTLDPSHPSYLWPTTSTPELNLSTNILTIPPHPPKSPIFSLLTPYPRELAKWCQKKGLVVRAIMPPTVPVGTQRVRVCLHAGNSERDVERFVRVLGEWVEMMGEKERDSGREKERGKKGGRVGWEGIKAVL